MLRKIRISLAIVCFTALTLLFLDFSGAFHKLFGWLAKVQLVPAVLAVNVVVIAALVLLTLLFGRVYCSVICPLGVFQDLVAWFSKLRKKKKRFPYKFAKPLTWLRFAVLGVFVVALLFAPAMVFGLIEPYTIFGKIASNIFAPIYKLGNNVLAYFAANINSYAFYPTEVWVKSGWVLGVAVVSFATIAVLSWRNGRIYCNSICPVGTTLGLISKFALFKPTIIESKCNRCGTCARKCKSQCIDSKEHKIDYSRCVACFDCVEACDKHAMKFVFNYDKKEHQHVSAKAATKATEKIDSSKRDFLTVAGILTASVALKAQESAVDGGLAVIEKKKVPKRTTSLVPAGAVSLRNVNSHCTACQLCISACPNNVLRPSSRLENFMQPEMQYERGFCRPECTKCSSVCPTGAIEKIKKEEKSSIQIGHAVWIRQNCLAVRDEISCSACEQHCPIGAISRVPLDEANPQGVKIPVVDEERCIGCGACEYLCPSRPLSAIYVEGHEVHKNT
ncbi:MAG: 4Fe-4S binding protein [Prevotellaceae bacterium]|jgi:polyferredoxin|nr:4Fe-4S binding protein [Prevotellaceae bacterium]